MSWGVPVRSAVGACDCSTCGGKATPARVAGLRAAVGACTSCGDTRPNVRVGAAFARVGECAPCKAKKKCSCSVSCSQADAMKRVGILGAERAVPWNVLEDMDASIRQYGTDVAKWVTETTATSNPGATAAALYKLKWDGWYVGWRIYFDQKAAGNWFDFALPMPKGIYGQDNLAEFDRLRAEYDELRRQGIDLGVKTDAPEAPTSAIEDLVQDIEGAGKEGAHFAGGAAAGVAKGFEWATIALVLGAVGVGALLLYPIAAPAFAAAVARAKKV